MAVVGPGGTFFDTNVIVYSQDGSEPVKQRRARALMDAAMRSGRFVIGTQVLQEFYNVAVRKGWMSPAHALQLLRHLAEHPVMPASADSVLRAVALQQQHRLSVWDALIVQQALDGRCALLYSEDLQGGRRFEVAGGGAELVIVNPFEDDGAAAGPAVHEPAAAAYGAPPTATKRARRVAT